MYSPELFEAMTRATEALRMQADHVSQAPQYKANDEVGKVLRMETAKNYQYADMLEGHIKRARKDGLPVR